MGLDQEFLANPEPPSNERLLQLAEIVSRLDGSVRTKLDIRVYFQNRRQRARKSDEASKPVTLADTHGTDSQEDGASPHAVSPTPPQAADVFTQQSLSVSHLHAPRTSLCPQSGL